MSVEMRLTRLREKLNESPVKANDKEDFDPKL